MAGSMGPLTGKPLLMSLQKISTVDLKTEQPSKVIVPSPPSPRCFQFLVSRQRGMCSIGLQHHKKPLKAVVRLEILAACPVSSLPFCNLKKSGGFLLSNSIGRYSGSHSHSPCNADDHPSVWEFSSTLGRKLAPCLGDWC